MATFNFNASAIEPAAPRSYQPLPAGSYEMMVTASDVKATKTGTGHYVELEMQVTDGEHSGRRHWERLNIDNPNKQAEEIAKKALAALCLAIGRPDIKDTDDLLDTPFTAVVEIHLAAGLQGDPHRPGEGLAAAARGLHRDPKAGAGGGLHPR